MQTLLKVARAIDRFTESIGWICQWIVVITISVGFYNVAARYLGRFLGVQLASNTFIELQWYLFSLIFFLGFAYILKHGDNVRVDFIYAKLNEKRRSLIDLLGTILFLIPFCLIGIYVTINPVLLSWGRLPNGTWGNWEISSDVGGLPRAPIKTMIIVAFLLLLLQAISQVIKYIAVLRGYEEVAEVIRAETSEQPPIE
jgi:TRAP-type mannitol/chloroaromatic compound transport system permease small subunit